MRPQLEYACSVKNPYIKRNIHQIELVQHRAARFVFRDYSNFSHVTPMLKQLGWDTLELRRLSYQLSMFYKIQHTNLCNFVTATPKPYKLLIFFTISVIFLKTGKHSDFRISSFQVVDA